MELRALLPVEAQGQEGLTGGGLSRIGRRVGPSCWVAVLGLRVGHPCWAPLEPPRGPPRCAATLGRLVVPPRWAIRSPGGAMLSYPWRTISLSGRQSPSYVGAGISKPSGISYTSARAEASLVSPYFASHYTQVASARGHSKGFALPACSWEGSGVGVSGSPYRPRTRIGRLVD